VSGEGCDYRLRVVHRLAFPDRAHARRARTSISWVDLSYTAVSAAWAGDAGGSRSSSARISARLLMSAESSSFAKSSLLVIANLALLAEPFSLIAVSRGLVFAMAAFRRRPGAAWNRRRRNVSIRLPHRGYWG
jgi:hypothetical protein